MPALTLPAPSLHRANDMLSLCSSWSKSIPFSVLTLTLLIVLYTSGCTPGQADPEAEAAFLTDYEGYRAQRIADLQAPDSWLTLVGLHWLGEGENRFGSDPENEVVFPEDRAPARMGTFILADSSVRMTILPGVEVLHAEAPTTDLMMITDADSTTAIAEHGSLSWYVIRRGDRFAIRVKDSQSPTLTGFTGIDTYPPSLDWRIEATFEPYEPHKPIPVPDVFGNIADRPALGALVFEHDGQPYRLDVIRDGDEPKFFLLFSDDTNGKDTYGAGRYLKVEEPSPGDNRVVIDFNKAYNPPCVFTPYATCPFPPRQNDLPFRVEAGEKNWGKGL